MVERPIIGRLQAAVTPKPTVGELSQSTIAWKVGAEGEARVAEVLAQAPGVEVLHDRRIPGSRANIDHIAVGPGGVFVIDAKKYKEGSLVEIRDKGGLLRRDLRLYVGGRDRSKLVDGVRGQVDVVRTALGPEMGRVPVVGVLCFVGATWGFPARPRTVDGVTAVWPKRLPKLVAGSRGPGLDAVRVAAYLRAVLPPAARS